MEGLGRHRRVPLGHKDVRGRPLLALQAPQRAYLVALHRVDINGSAGRGLPQRIPLSPSAMAETTQTKKMPAFDDEVALTIAPFYLVHMLQRTLPAGFIAPCLPTKTD
jgi:hypothetical protein